MELELEQDLIRCFETVGQTTICQEETQEAIVPDACPDILRIADVCAQAFPERWEAREGQAALYGKVQAVILYVPETGQMLQRMEVSVPFVCRSEMAGVGPDGIVEGCVRLRSADARILNPRKVLLRCDLAAELRVYQKKEYAVSVGAGRGDDGSICLRKEMLEQECLVSVPQRIFPVSEEVRLTGNQPPTLLSCRVEALCTESRLIGSKLIFKGRTQVDLLLQSGDGELEHRVESYLISQILEAKGAGESGECRVSLEIGGLMCTQSEEDPYRVALDIEVLAQGQVRERATLTVLSDLYSTTHETKLETQRLQLCAPCEETVIPQSLRDLLETRDVVRSVCDCRFDLGRVTHGQEGAELLLGAQGEIVLLYLDEERQLRRAAKPVEVTARLTLPEGTRVDVRCTRAGELFAAPCAGGIEVRLELEFHVLAAAPCGVDMVGRAEVGQSRESDSRRPSVILRLPEPDESLWDIAKACGTTIERIVQANELSGEELPPRKMLLIPSAG